MRAFSQASARPACAHSRTSGGLQLLGKRQRHAARSLVAFAGKKTVELTLEGAPMSVDVSVPDGASVYSVALSKPLGMVIEEKEGGKIVVAEVSEGGNAANAQEKISVGDQVLAVSGRELEGRSRTVADNQMNEQKDSLFGDPVLMATEGETFDTVMAAIQSNSAAKSYVAVVLARA